jgi:hypothetical protein
LLSPPGKFAQLNGASYFRQTLIGNSNLDRTARNLMNEMIEKLAKAMLEFNSPAEYIDQVPDGGWSSLLNDAGRDYWRAKARHFFEIIRELPEEPGPRYAAGEYSRSSHEAMIDDVLNTLGQTLREERP